MFGEQKYSNAQSFTLYFSTACNCLYEHCKNTDKCYSAKVEKRGICTEELTSWRKQKAVI